MMGQFIFISKPVTAVDHAFRFPAEPSSPYYAPIGSYAIEELSWPTDEACTRDLYPCFAPWSDTERQARAVHRSQLVELATPKECLVRAPLLVPVPGSESPLLALVPYVKADASAVVPAASPSPSVQYRANIRNELFLEHLKAELRDIGSSGVPANWRDPGSPHRPHKMRKLCQEDAPVQRSFFASENVSPQPLRLSILRPDGSDKCCPPRQPSALLDELLL